MFLLKRSEILLGGRRTVSPFLYEKSWLRCMQNWPIKPINALPQTFSFLEFWMHCKTIFLSVRHRNNALETTAKQGGKPLTFSTGSIDSIGAEILCLCMIALKNQIENDIHKWCLGQKTIIQEERKSFLWHISKGLIG